VNDAQAIAEIADMSAELDKRARRFKRIKPYIKGPCPLPEVIVKARVTKAYRMLMGMASTPYGRLIIKAASSRMVVGGVRSTDESADTEVWEMWQANRMDSEARLGIFTALGHGRVFAILWPGAPYPSITLENPDTVIVRYREGSRYDVEAALRRWTDGGREYATLYHPDFIYKFKAERTGFVRRIVDGEDWPLQNTEQIVPVAEISTNRDLEPGAYGHTSGDLEHVTGMLDRINVLEFLRLVMAFSAGFPIRAVVGDKILYEDDGKTPIAPYELAADVIAQFEDPNTKLVEIPAANIKGFGDAIDHDIEALAGVTQTPSYYLRAVPIQNIAADAIRASDTPLNSRVLDHQAEVGEGFEQMLRIGGKMMGVELPVDAQIAWVNREFRSISERADAVSKLAPVMPWQIVMEQVFDASQGDIARWEAMRATESLLNPPPTPAAP
jgi:hypothetical protein